MVNIGSKSVLRSDTNVRKQNLFHFFRGGRWSTIELLRDENICFHMALSTIQVAKNPLVIHCSWGTWNTRKDGIVTQRTLTLFVMIGFGWLNKYSSEMSHNATSNIYLIWRMRQGLCSAWIISCNRQDSSLG